MKLSNPPAKEFDKNESIEFFNNDHSVNIDSQKSTDSNNFSVENSKTNLGKIFIDPERIVKVEIRFGKKQKESKKEQKISASKISLNKELCSITDKKSEKMAEKGSSTAIKSPWVDFVDCLETPGGYLSLLCTIHNNLNILKQIKPSGNIEKIKDVLVFADKDKKIRDYWGILNFKQEKGIYLDDSGFYQGRLVDNMPDVLQKGILTKNGFYQSKELSSSEIDKQFETSKFLITEISKIRKISIRDLINTKCNLSLADRLIFSKNYRVSPQITEKVIL